MTLPDRWRSKITRDGAKVVCWTPERAEIFADDLAFLTGVDRWVDEDPYQRKCRAHWLTLWLRLLQAEGEIPR
mgnify:CR=1 FL=1